MNSRLNNVRFRSVLRSALTVLTLLVLLTGYGWYRFGSFGALVAVLSGRVAHLEPKEIALGDVVVGKPMAVPVRLKNLTSSRLRVLGSNSTCNCVGSVEGLPCELQPWESREFFLRFTMVTTEIPNLDVVVTFYVNAEGQAFQSHLTGHVVSSNSTDKTPGPEGKEPPSQQVSSGLSHSDAGEHKTSAPR